MKKNSKLIHILIFICVSTLVLVGLYLLLGKFVFDFSKKMQGGLKSEQGKLQEVEQMVRSVPNPQKALEEMDKKTAEFRELSYNKKQIPKLVQLLVKSATELNINVVTIRPREDIKNASDGLPPGVTKVYMELVLNCDYKSLAGFLNSLSTLPFAFVVDSLSLAKRENADGLEATLLVSTFMVGDTQ